jgi:hypothetical protein
MAACHRPKVQRSICIILTPSGAVSLSPGAFKTLCMKANAQVNSLVTGKFTGNFAPQEPSYADQTARKCLPIGHFLVFGACPVKNRAGNFRTGIGNYLGVIRKFIALSVTVHFLHGLFSSAAV